MISELLASVDDIQTHLPEDKLDVSSNNAEEPINRYEIDAERLIKGYLSGVYNPPTLAVWVSPATTPDFIRSIAGRFIAAFYYALRYSEDIEHENSYGQGLYNEAMSMLECVRIGDVILPDPPTPIQGTMFGEQFFQPNSTSTPPKFSMDNVFG